MTSREQRWNTLLDTFHGALSFMVGPSALRPRLVLRATSLVTGRGHEELEQGVRGVVEGVREWRLGVVREWIGGGVLHHGAGQAIVAQGVTQALLNQ